jgi:hypothetical protein
MYNSPPLHFIPRLMIPGHNKEYIFYGTHFYLFGAKTGRPLKYNTWSILTDRMSHFTDHNTDSETELMPVDDLANGSKIMATFRSVNNSRSVTVRYNVMNVERQVPSGSPSFLNCVRHVITYVYSIAPLIGTLVIPIANYQDRYGPSA